jgi:hypothetical protein
MSKARNAIAFPSGFNPSRMPFRLIGSPKNG